MRLTERELCHAYGKPDPIAEEIDRSSGGSILTKYDSFLRYHAGNLTVDELREKLYDEKLVKVRHRTLAEYLKRENINFIKTYAGKPVRGKSN